MTGCMHGHPVTAQGREGSGPRATGGELQAPKLTGLGVPGPHEATLANVPTSRSRRGAPCWGSAQFRARGSCRHVALSKPLAPGLGLPSWVLEQPGWPRCPVHTVPSPSSVGSGVNAQRAGSTGSGGGGLSPLFMVTTRRHLPLSPCRGPSRTPASVRGGPQPTSVHKHQGRGTEPPGSAPAGAWSSASPCWRPCAMTTEAAGSHWRLTQRPLRRAAQPDWACMARGGRDGQRPRPLAPPVSRAGQAPRDPGPRLLAQQPQRERSVVWRRHHARPCTRRAAQHPLAGSSSAHGPDGEIEAQGTESPTALSGALPSEACWSGVLGTEVPGGRLSQVDPPWCGGMLPSHPRGLLRRAPGAGLPCGAGAEEAPASGSFLHVAGPGPGRDPQP